MRTTNKGFQLRNKRLHLKAAVVPGFVDEDPQLNPERWWERRQKNQALNRL